MTITAVSIPTPPNGDMDRAMFVWVPAVGGANDPLSSDANIQSLLNLCSTNGINLLFVDIWAYLGGGNFTTARAQVFQKFIHYAHASGIRVHALGGNTDWGTNQQWVMTNIVKNIAQYQAYCASNSVNTEGNFDGVVLDAEYWATPGYTSTDVMGMCDLIKSIRSNLSLPVGFAPTWWSTDPGSSALSFTYDGYTGLEGFHLMNTADYCVIQAYANTSVSQESRMQYWFNYASQTGLNLGLYCASLTDSGFGTASYYTGAVGAKATMETAHTAISNYFTGSGTNASFRGQAIEQYSTYKTML